MTRHLHSYPKTFNRWGHLKKFPFQAIPRYNMRYIFSSAVAMSIIIYGVHRMAFQYFNSAQTLQGDKNQLLIKKRSFDSLILGTKIKTQREQVFDRSFF